MATVLLSIEGVLTDTSENNDLLASAEASNSGKILYAMLRDSARVVLLSADPIKDRVAAWLARERFSRYADLHCYPAGSVLTPAEWRVQHAKDLLGVGHHIAFFIDSDPAVVAQALNAGINGILVAPSSTTPGYRSGDMGYTSWYDLVESIERQKLVRASRSPESTDDP